MALSKAKGCYAIKIGSLKSVHTVAGQNVKGRKKWSHGLSNSVLTG